MQLKNLRLQKFIDLLQQSLFVLHTLQSGHLSNPAVLHVEAQDWELLKSMAPNSQHSALWYTLKGLVHGKYKSNIW